MIVRASRPPILDAILDHRHAVVEASAGTGKTWTIERIVIDLLLGRGDRPPVEIEEILVVTFTDRATRELRHRIRSMVDTLARQRESDAADGAAWHIDEAARRRLDRARFRFDSASISTIHGFCQRVLADEAIASGGHLDLSVADGRAGVEEALRERLPTLAEGELLGPVLVERFAEDGDHALESLVDLVSEARRVGWDGDDAAGVARARSAVHSALASFDMAQVADAFDGWKHPDLATASRGLLDVEPGARVDALIAGSAAWIAALMTKGRTPTERKRIPDALAGIGPTLIAAVALDRSDLGLFEHLVPDVLGALRRLRAARGEVDFTDMLRRVADAMDAPNGDRLVRALRRRHRVAIVDEFQDTDDVQWRIFDRAFGQSDNHRLIVIGDPKQAIYSFRGGDVFTWLAARRALEQRGGAVASLDRTWRSTIRLTESLNTLLSADAATPILSSPDIGYDTPVAPGHTGWRDGLVRAGTPLQPIVALRLGGADLRLPEARARWSAALVDHLADLLSAHDPVTRTSPDGSERPLRAADVFVLTRSNAEVDEILGALQRAGLPAVTLDRSVLFEQPEARGVRAVVRAIVDPWDPVARVRAFTTPVFGAPWDDAGQAAALDPEHPWIAALAAARRLVDRGRFDAAFAHVCEVGGFEPRMLATEPDPRPLGRWRQVFDVVGLEARRRRVDADGLVRLVDDLVTGRELPSDEADRTPRAEASTDAITVMTMHASKGLQAPVVALYGGFRAPRARGEFVVTHPAGARRAVPRIVATPDDLADEKREAREERERLLYVAMTRAACQLIVPWAPPGTLGSRSRLSGEIAPLNARLDELLDPETPDGDLDASLAVSVVAADRDAPAVGRVAGQKDPSALLDRLMATPRVESVTPVRRPRPRVSYSSLKRAAHARADAQGAADRDRVRLDAPHPDALPRGAAVGSALHRIAELAPVPKPGETCEAWSALGEVDVIVRESLARYGVDPRHGAEAARLVFAALRVDVPVAQTGERLVGGLAAAPRILPEVEFFYPVATGGTELGTAIGYIDAVVDIGGRLLIVDYKSDSLPDWTPETVDAHVAENYATQPLIYALGLARWLGIDTRAEWDARVAGHAWIFFRGVASGGASSDAAAETDAGRAASAAADRVRGVHTGRVSWDALIDFEARLCAQLGEDA